jgi:hypothetical protein
LAGLSVPVIALAGELELAGAATWFAHHSHGDFAPDFETVARIDLGSLGRYLALGGLDRHPNNSQGLVEAALDRLDRAGQTRLAALRRPLLVVASPGFRPHCWHLPGGGRRLAGDGAVHRYAVLPEDATLGAIVHELGHLLFDWPDLERDSGLGSECLMARGALLPEPAPPCAVLRLRAGWITPRVPERGLRVGELEIGEAVAIGERVIERRSNPDRLLVLLDRPRPVLLRRIELRREDLERPLLAVARFG